ncbi:MAG: hypothetical protein IT423_16220 [Pirellulaceae bacterium]|nr:hypothetical protein [Pirellulaceae bacterium]
MSIQNIQTLFGTISLSHVIAYMTQKKWRVHASADRLDFELPDAAGESQHLFMPAQQTHPKFRSLLPNLIFSLAVIEQREALDVANEMVKSVLPETKPALQPEIHSGAGTVSGSSAAVSSPSTAGNDARVVGPIPVELTFVNEAGQPATVACGAGSSAITLGAGQAIAVSLGRDTTSMTIQFQDRLQLDVATGATLDAFWPQIELPSRTLLEQIAWLKAQLASWSHAIGRVEAEVKLQPALERFDFALQGLSSPSIDLRSWSLASAQLLCEAVHCLDDADRSPPLAYQCARHLASLVGGRIRVTGDGASSLWNAAGTDQPTAPHRTHQWLTKHCHILAS